jgi:hypothetical protein
MISIQELFSADLRTLVSIQEELQKEATPPAPLQPNRPRKSSGVPTAFNDTWLRALVSDHGGGEPNAPDCKISIDGDRAKAEFLADIHPTTFDSRDEKGVEGFVRDKSATTLLRNVIWVKDTVAALLEDIVSHQEAYLVTNDVRELRPLTQYDLAYSAKLHNSTVSKLTMNRTVVAPDGHLMPLNSLIVGEEKIERLSFLQLILQEYPDLTDVPSSRELREMFDLPMHERTIRKYMKVLTDHKKTVEDRKARERDQSFPDLSTLEE